MVRIYNKRKSLQPDDEIWQEEILESEFELGDNLRACYLSEIPIAAQSAQSKSEPSLPPPYRYFDCIDYMQKSESKIEAVLSWPPWAIYRLTKECMAVLLIRGVIAEQELVLVRESQKDSQKCPLKEENLYNQEVNYSCRAYSKE
jgi:hypothetical protein